MPARLGVVCTGPPVLSGCSLRPCIGTRSPRRRAGHPSVLPVRSAFKTHSCTIPFRLTSNRCIEGEPAINRFSLPHSWAPARLRYSTKVWWRARRDWFVLTIRGFPIRGEQAIGDRVNRRGPASDIPAISLTVHPRTEVELAPMLNLEGPNSNVYGRAGGRPYGFFGSGFFVSSLMSSPYLMVMSLLNCL